MFIPQKSYSLPLLEKVTSGRQMRERFRHPSAILRSRFLEGRQKACSEDDVRRPMENAQGERVCCSGRGYFSTLISAGRMLESIRFVCTIIKSQRLNHFRVF